MALSLFLRPLGRAGLLLLLGLLLAVVPGYASHIRAGDIQAKSDTTAARNPLRIFFKMVTYTDPRSGAHTINNETIFFGDGTNATVTRFSQTQLTTNVYRNVYYFEHTYTAVGSYTVSHLGEYRAAGIRNVPLSDTRSFFLQTRISITPVVGLNRSPILHAPAVDLAANEQVYLHNPAASDPDGDSLAFSLMPSQYDPRSVSSIQSNNGNPNPVDLPGYVYPNLVSAAGVVPTQVAYTGPPVGTPGSRAIMEIDPRTGQLVWNAPGILGDYNVAIKVEEWRRDANGGRRLIGWVVRDMQITVFATLNQRPTIFIPRDTCVVAGTNITRSVRATDPNNHTLRLSAFGGMLPSPASFVQTVSQPGSAVARFSWTTSCSDVASDAKIVLFRVEDQPGTTQSLIDERPWRIKVVGPPPTNLRPTQQGRNVQLTWDRYFCQNASRILIFRKENAASWTPGECETGIPASAGYTQIGEVASNLQSFLDDNNGRGLDRGKTYCYRIYAEFPRPAGGASIASQEACLSLPGRAALLKNVTVDRTDASTGQITVNWTKPVAAAGSFGTPAGYRLYRAELPSTSYVLVRTFTNLSDTTHVDTNLNTDAKAYNYRLEFFSGTPEVVETAGPASSVRVSAVPNPGVSSTIEVRWSFNVPWNNAGARTRVYRKTGSTGTYTLLTSTATSTATGGIYLDADPALRLNSTYCYYVETVGRYDAPNQPQNLVNRSQELCVPLQPRVCRPILTLQGPDCDRLAEQARQFPSPLPRPLTFTNVLSWTVSSSPAGCSANIVEYRVLYSPSCDSTAFQELGRTPTTSFTHSGLTSAAGCYRVVAVNAEGTTANSNIVSGDNCRIFVLPNVISPNNDQQNDTFRPIFASAVSKVEVQIFNRWGAKVYEGVGGTDLTLWDGGGASGEKDGGRDQGAKVSGSTYYYLIKVEFADQARTRQTFKGWVEVVR